MSRIYTLITPLRILFATLPLLFLASCSAEHVEDRPAVGDGNAMISFNLSRGGQPATYALSGDAERTVTELDILLFDRSGELSQAPIEGEITMDPATGIGEVTATVPIARYHNILLLANSRAMVTAVTPTLAVGMPKDDVMKLFEMTLADKWNATSGSAGYKDIPMYGETGEVNVNQVANNNFSASLLRMLVRVDVHVTTQVRPIFSLKNIHVYNRNTVGRLFPSPDNTKVNLPSNPNRVKGPLVYDGAEITTTNISSEGEIYLFESAIVSDVDGNDMRRVDDATCLVIGGAYTPAYDPVNTVVTYYRIDFAHILAADNLKHYYDILRNRQYNINVISVSGPGEKTPEEALNTEISRIEIEVLDWEQGGDIGGDIDGQDILRVAPGSFTFNYPEHTTANINNKIAVSSTHTDGWKVSKVMEFDGTNEIETNGTGWLNTSPAIGAPQMGPTVSLLLKENPNPTPRVGYIYISSGPRMSYKVKVTQGERPEFLGKIIWDDYDGANDTDKGLTTITLEQMGESPQTSTIKDGVITPKLEVYGSIEKITATYKGYVLTLLSTTHSLDYPNEEISVSDRTLIGKAIHLDKVRNGLKGHYIQVDDIDLNGYTGINGETNNFKPISSSSTPFQGSYDGGLGKDGQGKGFVIKNLNIDRTTDNTSLFGYTINAILKNIHIVSGTIKGSGYTAGICSIFYGAGSITGCSNAATIIGNYGAAGICGVNHGKMSNCTNSGAIQDFTAYGGGICGENRGSIQDCKNTGDLLNSASVQAGGVCGVNSVAYATVLRCENTGSVSGFASIGGICGEMYDKTTIKESNNSGRIIGTAGANGGIGGICGFIKGGSEVAISGCHNSGEISGLNENIGGICGQNGEASKAGRKIEKSTNKAAVSGRGVAPAILSSYVGGICGISFGAGSIANCNNLTVGAIINGTGDYVGGIAGKYEGATDIETCKNEATVTGQNYVGGLFGSSAAKIGLMCSSSGVVTGANYAGNICGENRGTITGVTNSTPIMSAGGYIGGFVGDNKGTIEQCINAAAVTGKDLRVGGIAGNHDGILGKITKCTNTEDGVVNGTGSVGGITGESVSATGQIKDCENNAIITGTASNVGGIIGKNTATAAAERNENRGPVNGTSSVGGICGYIHAEASLKDSYNYAIITGSAGEVGGICGKIADFQTSITNCHNAENAKINGKLSQVGGIAGMSTSSTINGCTNKAVVAGVGVVTQVGGIVGSNTGVIIACSNTGAISGTTKVGGVAGESSGYSEIKSSSNNSTVNGTSSVGGIVGYITGSNSRVVSCVNSDQGAVTAGGNNAGGISGEVASSATVTACINRAPIKGNTYIGGISGDFRGAFVSDSYNLGTITGIGQSGPIVGYPLPPTNCYFGEGANNFSTTTGSTKFGASPNWPNESTPGWSTSASGLYWGNLGSWNGGVPTYPTLRPIS